MLLHLMKNKRLNRSFVFIVSLLLVAATPFLANSTPLTHQAPLSGANGNSRVDLNANVNVQSQSPLVVPTQFQTIQAAVNAAAPGDTIKILPGTYIEQINISKNLKVVGSGEESTFIKAPFSLSSDSSGLISIVDINKGATVALSKLTVTGPGSTTCGAGSLFAGILVVENATLHLSSATVTKIHNVLQGFCYPNGSGIVIGLFQTTSIGHATIFDVKINEYEFDGIGILSPGSTASISNSVITGAGLLPGMFTTGIVMLDGVSASVTHNKITKNHCQSSDLPCGKDLITQNQAIGIAAINVASGTVIGGNDVSDSDVGIFLYGSTDCCTVNDNSVSNNKYFGMAIQDGNQTIARNVITGGEVGVGVVADLVDTVGTLVNDKISGTSIKPIQEIACCGFKATASIQNRQ